MRILFLAVLFLMVSNESVAEQSERNDIIETNEAIRKGFVEQDIDAILMYHHPEVEKVFAWDDYQKGHTDMREALSQLFSNYKVSFRGEASEMESLKILDDSAVMIANFTLDGEPVADDGEPFTYSGKTMIVYVKSSTSKTGWVTLREMVVPK